jgi:methylmalonyl-CoA/ethylmalonyl-CoA epimerase
MGRIRAELTKPKEGKMAGKIAHIGIAVTDLTEAVRAFSTVMNADPESLEEVTDQKVKTAIFAAGESKVELLEGTSDDSPISKFIQKKGPGIHHVALEVTDIEKELSRLKDAGVRLIDETPRVGVGGTRVAFIHPKSTAGILVELREKEQ